ncbi:MAG: hypothetical protein JSW52_12320, partial [Candidatus Coatesbacteria bacterium]
MPEIYRGDLYGLRKHKYGDLGTTGVTDTEWAEVEPTSPFYLFAEVDTAAAEEYKEHIQITSILGTGDRRSDSGKYWSTGLITARDSFVIDFNNDALAKRILRLINPDKEKQVIDRYKLKDTREIPLKESLETLRGMENPLDNIKELLYRPFDKRFIFYDQALVRWPVYNIMRHLLARENLAFITVRQVAEGVFNHAYVADSLVESRITLSNKGIAYIFPYYLYPGSGTLDDKESGNRSPNIEPGFASDFLAAVGAQTLENSPEVGQRSGSREILYAEDIFYYIYGVLHSPTYRERYAEFLKLDFPRIPIPVDYESFDRLAAAGQRLAELHLLKDKDRWGWQGIEQRGDAKEAVVGKVEYDEKNEEIIFDAKKPPDEQYRLGPVPVH